MIRKLSQWCYPDSMKLMVDWEIAFHQPTMLPVWLTVNFWFELDDGTQPTWLQCVGFIVGYIAFALLVAFNIVALHDLVTKWGS